jgi:spore maturation protein CgeB
MVIGEGYFHYTDSLVNACKNMGHEVHMVTSIRFKNKKNNYWEKQALKLGFKNIEKQYYENMNLNFEKIAENFKPTICIIINGLDISISFLAYLKKQKIRSVLFLMDSIKNDCFKSSLKNLSYYDKFFSYEPSDKEFLLGKYNDLKYLFVGYDDTIFYPAKDEYEQGFDICFVGALYNERLTLLETVAKYAYDNNKKFVVHTMPLFHGQYIWHKIRSFFRYIKFNRKYFYLKKYLVDIPLFNESLSKLYNKSKICINIHDGSNDRHSGVNPRTFEILGCKSFQLIDENHLNEIELKSGRHLVEYKDADDLCKKIDYYLENEKERQCIADAGYQIVKEKYTMKECMKIILEEV